MSEKGDTEKNKRKNKLNLIGKMLEIPADPLCRSAHINLQGENFISVDGCYGIIQYSTEEIILNIGNKILILEGADFDISDYSAGKIAIKGKIYSLKYSER